MKALLSALVAFVTAAAAAQESAASRAAPLIKLPVADQGTPFEEKDAIVVEVFRSPAPAGKPADAWFDVGRGWRIRVGKETYGTDQADLSRLSLAFVAAIRSGGGAESRPSR
jgi:hypothetical protein